jgi:hypothetical protein
VTFMLSVVMVYVVVLSVVAPTGHK